MSQTTKRITVERRGHFDDDAFFKDSWSEWDHAMKDAVNRWDRHTGKKTTTLANIPGSETKSVYRQIRSSNVTSDESQAVSCTEEDTKYKMVMDVKDFSPEDMSLKVVDDTIVVEGKIHKEEGNSVTTQKFVRRFLLPPEVNMNAISSALSKDGVLTITAPKFAMPPSKSKVPPKDIPLLNPQSGITTRILGHVGCQYGRPNFIQISGGPYAGKPSIEDNEPFNPTGGCNVTVYETTTPRGPPRHKETVILNIHDKKNKNPHSIQTKTDGSNQWTNFNTMCEKSQKEMEDMMKTHTLTDRYGRPITNGSIISAPSDVTTTKDVTRTGNTVTERQEKKWDDQPSPGVNRTNRALQENSEIKSYDGSVIGNRNKMEQESKAEGSREEILPDGSKRTVFTKTYENKNSYIANSR